MSTHNICFYGELMKNYSSVIIKYPLYLFICYFQLEGEKNKLENLLQNNLMKKRDRILLDIQEESSQTNQEKLETSSSELEQVDTRVAELKTRVKSMNMYLISSNKF